MSLEEYNDFLSELNKLKTNQEKLAFAEKFYSHMVQEHDNQFEPNGLIDDLTKLINELRKSNDN